MLFAKIRLGIYFASYYRAKLHLHARCGIAESRTVRGQMAFEGHQLYDMEFIKYSIRVTGENGERKKERKKERDR